MRQVVKSWPCRVAPLAEELLSSWMIRLAHAHRLKCESFVTLAFDRQFPIWNRDIDRTADDEVVERLALISGVDAGRIREATLLGLCSQLSRRGDDGGTLNGIMPLGIFHRSRRRNGLAFCPICLIESATPHFRQAWRISYFTGCVRHSVYLRDCCSHCSAPLAPHRADARWAPSTRAFTYVRCWNCTRDLRNCVAERILPQDMWIHGRLDATLKEGCALISEQVIPAPAFFDGVRVLAYAWRRGLNIPGARVWEYWDIAKRHACLTAVGKWLQDWPESFLREMRNTRQSMSDIRGSGTPGPPYWVDRVLRESLMIKRVPVQPAEIAWALNALIADGVPASIAAARQVLKKDIPRNSVPAAWRSAMTVEVYEHLLAQMDQQISGTSDLKTRCIVLADKVWIALGCAAHMSLAELARLSVGDLAQLAKGRSLKRRRAPQTLAEVRPWLRSYLAEIRPELGAMTLVAPAFPRGTDGCYISANGLSMRFRSHLLQANLDKEIASFSEVTRGLSARNVRSAC